MFENIQSLALFFFSVGSPCCLSLCVVLNSLPRQTHAHLTYTHSPTLPQQDVHVAVIGMPSKQDAHPHIRRNWSSGQQYHVPAVVLHTINHNSHESWRARRDRPQRCPMPGSLCGNVEIWRYGDGPVMEHASPIRRQKYKLMTKQSSYFILQAKTRHGRNE